MKKALNYLFSFLVMVLIGVGIHHLKKGSQSSKDMTATMVDSSASANRNPGIRAAGKVGVTGATVSALEKVEKDREEREFKAVVEKASRTALRWARAAGVLGKEVDIELALYEREDGYLAGAGKRPDGKPEKRYVFGFVVPPGKHITLDAAQYQKFQVALSTPLTFEFMDTIHPFVISEQVSVYTDPARRGKYAVIIKDEGHRWFDADG